MKEQLIDQIMQEVMKKIDSPKGEEKTEAKNPKNNRFCDLTEFVGIGHGDTIGLVIANVDSALHEAMGLDKKVPFHRHFRRTHRCGTANHGSR